MVQLYHNIYIYIEEKERAETEAECSIHVNHTQPLPIVQLKSNPLKNLCVSLQISSRKQQQMKWYRFQNAKLISQIQPKTK